MLDLFKRYLALRNKARTDIFWLALLLKYEILARDRALFHDVAYEFARKHRFYLLRIFRGSFKTTLITVLDTIQDVLNDPETRQLIISWTGDNAKDMLGVISDHFTLDENLRFLFPDILPQNISSPETGDWTRDGITVHRKSIWKESTIESLGADQNAVSKHYDKIRVDDIVVYENTRTSGQIEKTDEFIRKLTPLLNNHNDNASIGFLGTDWTPDDSYQKMKDGVILAPDGKKYKMFEMPSEYESKTGKKDKDGKNITVRIATYPARFPLKKLDGIRASDPLGYNALYLLNPVNKALQIWTKDLVQWYSELPNDLNLLMFGGLDPAISERDVKDISDTAFGIIGIDKKNHLWVLEYYAEGGMKGLNIFYDKIFDLYIRWKTMKIIKPNTEVTLLGDFRYFSIETKTFQKLILKDLRRLMEEKDIWIPVKEFNPVADKTSRIMILDGLMRNGGFHAKIGMTQLETQIIRFGQPNTKLDILDFISQAYSQSITRWIDDDQESEDLEGYGEVVPLATMPGYS